MASEIEYFLVKGQIYDTRINERFAKSENAIARMVQLTKRANDFMRFVLASENPTEDDVRFRFEDGKDSAGVERNRPYIRDLDNESRAIVSMTDESLVLDDAVKIEVTFNG